jgi:RNA polymerase sigma-70 factor, ECF subfamily
VNSEPASDLACLQALQEGEDSALDQLIARWQRPLFSFAWRYVQNDADAHDLVAETFVRLHQQRQRLRPDTKLAAWLFTTLSNLCHNHYRWRLRHPTVSLDASFEDSGAPLSEKLSPAEEPLPDAALEHREACAAVRAAIDRLPHDLRTTVLLHHYEHLSYREIGVIVGCSERGVETRLYRARQRLRDELAGFLHETIGR